MPSQERTQGTGEPARVFTEFFCQTRKTWSRSRRVVAKAEHLSGKENARYVVTSLALAAWPTRELYEQLYCARGEMENRIKEQLSLFSDRMSTESLRSNQLRLYFSALAYVLVEAFRLRLLKIAAQVRITARKIWIRYAKAYPWKNPFVSAGRLYAVKGKNSTLCRETEGGRGQAACCTATSQAFGSGSARHRYARTKK